MIEKRSDLDLQPKQEVALENGQIVSKEFFDLVRAYRFPGPDGEPTESEADALKMLEKEKKHYEQAYYPRFVKDNLYQIISSDGRKLINTSKRPSDLRILAPAEIRPKLEQAAEKRKKLITLINESLHELSGWRELLFTHDSHPYLNEAYAVIFAFLKEQGVQIKEAKILDVGFGGRLNAPQELAEQGAQSYAIDPNPHVPMGIQRKKATKKELMDLEYSATGYPDGFLIKRNELIEDGQWSKLPPTNTGGQVYFAHKTLESADKGNDMEDGSFDAVYSSELFEYGALYLPSEEKKWGEISKINLEIIFRKLKDNGIFVSRTMRESGFTDKQLKEAGFEVICFNLSAESFKKPYGSDNGIDEVNRAHIVVCRKLVRQMEAEK